MKLDQETRETAAVTIGGLAMAYLIILGVLLLVRDGVGWAAPPVAALVVWREYVFAGMRSRLRKK